METSLCSSNTLRTSFGNHNADSDKNPYSYRPRTINFSETSVAKPTDSVSQENRKSENNAIDLVIGSTNDPVLNNSDLQTLVLGNIGVINFETEINSLSNDIKTLITEKLKPLYNTDVFQKEKQVNKKLSGENKVQDGLESRLKISMQPQFL